jgi:DUF438 domain-containing protein
MPTIQKLMANDHRRCDDLFVEVEREIQANNWAAAQQAFSQFRSGVMQHFEAEETLLFPAFEAKTGMTQGPTQVMRGEHAEMRELLQAAAGALTARDGDSYSGEAETLLIMMQQHNVKEEHVLYPMCDQNLRNEADALMAQLEAHMAQA